jgi:hypothetical protein
MSECLWLGSLCKYFVVSNSAFGWWSAYLSKHIDKQVYAPGYMVLDQMQELVIANIVHIRDGTK